MAVLEVAGREENVCVCDSRCICVQIKLIERDLEALQAQLMESSITDTSGLSFFEHFHISPIKVRGKQLRASNNKRYNHLIAAQI